MRSRAQTAGVVLFASVVGLADIAAASCGVSSAVAQAEAAAAAYASGAGSDRGAALARALSQLEAQPGLDGAARAYIAERRRLLTAVSAAGEGDAGGVGGAAALAADPRVAGSARALIANAASPDCPDPRAPDEADEKAMASAASESAAAARAAGAGGASSNEKSGPAPPDASAASPSANAPRRLAPVAPLRIEGGAMGAAIRILPFVAIAAALLITFRSDGRGHRRFRCAVNVDVEHERRHFSTSLRDVSRAGAKIAMIEPAAPGARLNVTLEGRIRAARVIWANGAYAGLRFERLISEDLVVELRTRSQAEARAIFARREARRRGDAAA